MKKFWLFAALCAYASAVAAQNPSPATGWYRAGHVTLRLTDTARDFSAAWQFDRADNGDNRVMREERRGGAKINGTVMSICDDQALLMKGVTPERLHEMRELDEPVLHLQMVLRLLARAAPEGPAALGNEKLIEITEPAVPIRVRKGMEARRDFNAPWQARGRIRREAGGEIAYDIVLNHAGNNAQEARTELNLAGVWRQESRAHSFDNSFEIADWQVYRVNPVPVIVGGNTQIEPMATTKPLRYATLGHLRRHIERAWSPDPKVTPISECKP
jgi:hypothetical protein